MHAHTCGELLHKYGRQDVINDRACNEGGNLCCGIRNVQLQVGCCANQELEALLYLCSCNGLQCSRTIFKGCSWSLEGSKRFSGRVACHSTCETAQAPFACDLTSP